MLKLYKYGQILKIVQIRNLCETKFVIAHWTGSVSKQNLEKYNIFMLKQNLTFDST